MKQHLKLQLSSYSTFAAIFLLGNDSLGNAVYTDIEPDIVLVSDNELYDIDMDNDGHLDFRVQKLSGSFYSYWSDNLSYSNFIIISPLESGNEVAGIKSVINPSYGGFTLYFPYVIESSQLIDNGLSFQNNYFQILALNISGPSGAIGGYWYTGFDEKYIGVGFKDSLNCFHYGWIRCSTTSQAESVIIDSYTYETKCETGIYAGDTIGDTTTVEVAELSSLVPTIYSFAGVLNISLNKKLVGANYTVFNLEGKIIHTGYLDELNNKLNINCNEGVYLVIIKKDEYSYSKQILLVQ
ncbi:MAG: T9SS type A sorting domain-containing protein [Bacteroidetes bacterium]|nr:T9SS type A sorting domain-containing protein [Bacteroidota bacterium]MBK8342612.1 T9SS type A sorting domain-containing protein [Bacteroidota bacterium]